MNVIDKQPVLYGVKYLRRGTPVHLKIGDYEFVGRVMRATYINGKMIGGMAEIMFHIVDSKWEPYDTMQAVIDDAANAYPGKYFVFAENHLMERTET